MNKEMNEEPCCENRETPFYGGLPQFLGVKIIGAEPMDRFAFDRSKGMTPSTECENQAGYKVVYEDGYTSWSPKYAFEKAYRPTNGMNLGLAIEALKMGYKVARDGWNGKGMFIFIQNETSGPVEEGIPILSAIARKNQGILVRAHINMKAADDSIVIGWLASQTDMLSDDWCIVG